MAIFKYRVLSRVDIYDAFVACSFTIFIWTFYRIFNRVPSWLINLNIWEVLSVSAYALTIALFESILVFSFFALIGILLPAQYFLNKFVSHTTMIVFTSSLWAVAAQFNYDQVYNWSLIDRVPWIIAYLVSILITYGFTYFSERYAGLVRGIVRRISILATFYIILGVVGLLVVVIRNI